MTTSSFWSIRFSIWGTDFQREKKRGRTRLGTWTSRMISSSTYLPYLERARIQSKELMICSAQTNRMRAPASKPMP